MPYFFSRENLSQGLVVKLEGEEARDLLLSHRVKKGEQVKLQGPDGKRFLAETQQVEKKSLSLLCLQPLQVPPEPNTELVLFQAIVNEKALDFIFQKSTELGVVSIVLFNSQNTAVRLSADKFNDKKERWNKILQESAKQSERAVWPELVFVPDVAGLSGSAALCDTIHILDINGQQPNKNRFGKKTGLVVGPEGGFTTGELEALQALPGAQTMSLGQILLRAETAALAAIVASRTVAGY